MFLLKISHLFSFVSDCSSDASQTLRSLEKQGGGGVANDFFQSTHFLQMPIQKKHVIIMKEDIKRGQQFTQANTSNLKRKGQVQFYCLKPFGKILKADITLYKLSEHNYLMV